MEASLKALSVFETSLATLAGSDKYANNHSLGMLQHFISISQRASLIIEFGKSAEIVSRSSLDSSKFSCICLERNTIKWLCTSIIKFAQITKPTDAATEALSTVNADILATLQICFKTLISLAQTDKAQYHISGSIDILVSLAVDRHSNHSIASITEKRAVTGKKVVTYNLPPLPQRSTLDANSINMYISGCARRVLLMISLEGMFEPPFIDALLDQHVLTMILHKAQASAQTPELMANAAELAVLALSLLKMLYASCSDDEYERLSTLLEEDSIYRTISRLLCTFPINSIYCEYFEDAYLSNVALIQDSIPGNSTISTSSGFFHARTGNLKTRCVAFLGTFASAINDSSRNDKLCYRALSLLIKAYAILGEHAREIESKLGLFAKVCVAITNSSSRELVSLVFKATETISIAHEFIPRVAMTRLCVAISNMVTSESSVASADEASGESGGVSPAEFLKLMVKCIQTILDFKCRDIHRLGECGIMQNFVIPILGCKYTECACEDSGDHCKYHCMILNLLCDILIKSDIANESDAWANGALIMYLLRFIVDSHPDICKKRKSFEQTGEPNLSVTKRGQLSETVLKTLCKINSPVLVICIGQMLEHLTSVPHPGAVQLWKVIHAMLKVNKLVCEHFRTCGGFEKCISCLKASHGGSFDLHSFTRSILLVLAENLAAPNLENRHYFLRSNYYEILAKSLPSNFTSSDKNHALDLMEVMLGIFQGAPGDKINPHAIVLLLASPLCLDNENNRILAVTRLVHIIEAGGPSFSMAVSRTGALQHILSHDEYFTESCRSMTLKLFCMIGVHNINRNDLYACFNLIYKSLGSEISIDVLRTLGCMATMSEQQLHSVGQGAFHLPYTLMDWPPQKGITFSSWFLKQPSKRNAGPKFCLLNLSGPDGSIPLCELTVESNRCISLKAGSTVVKVELSKNIANEKWHHVLVSFKPLHSKRLDGNLLVCIDGISETNIPFMFSVPHQYSRKKGSLRYERALLCGTIGDERAKRLCLGPTLFASEATTVSAAACMFMKGPTHASPFLGSSPYDISASIKTLQKLKFWLHSGTLTGLGLDITSSRTMEQTHDLTCNFRFSGPETICFFFDPSARNIAENDALDYHKKRPYSKDSQYLRRAFSQPSIDFYVLPFCLSEDQIVIRYTKVNFHPTTLHISLQYIGGVMVLLPLLDIEGSMHTSLSDLCVPLNVIGALLNGNANVAPALEMKRLDGYRILGYLLQGIAERGLFDHSILDSVLYIVYGTKIPERRLVSDSDALQYILLNHAIVCQSDSGEYCRLRYHLLNSFVSLLTEETSCTPSTSERIKINSNSMKSSGFLFWSMNTMLEEALSIAGIKTVLAWHQSPVKLYKKLRQLIKLSGKIIRLLFVNSLPVLADLTLIRNVLIYIELIRSEHRHANTSGLTEMQASLIDALCYIYDTWVKGTTETVIIESFNNVFLADTPSYFSLPLIAFSPWHSVLMNLKLMLLLCQHDRKKYSPALNEISRLLNLIFTKEYVKNASDVGGIFVLLMAFWLGVPIGSIPTELLYLSSPKSQSSILTADSISKHLLNNLCGTEAFDQKNKQVVDEELLLRRQTLELTAKLLGHNISYLQSCKESRNDTINRRLQINFAVAEFLNIVVNSKTRHSGMIIFYDSEHFAHTISSIAFAAATVSDASRSNISTDSIDLTQHIVDGYVDYMQDGFPAEFNVKSNSKVKSSESTFWDGSKSGQTKDSLSVDPNMFLNSNNSKDHAVKKLCYTIFSILHGLLCSLLCANDRHNQTLMTQNDSGASQAPTCTNTIQCIFNIAPISASVNEVLSFAAAFLKVFRKRLHPNLAEYPNKSLFKSACASQLATICDYLCHRCAEGWYPVHSLDVVICILEIAREIQDSVAINGENHIAASTSLESFHWISIWVISQRNTSKTIVLKLLRIINISNDLVFGREAQNRSRMDFYFRSNTTKSSSVKSPIALIGRHSASFTITPAGMSQTDFVLALMHFTFQYLVDDNESVRSATVFLWRSLLSQQRHIFLEIIGAKDMHQTPQVSRSCKQSSNDLYTRGFELLLTDVNQFSIWIAAQFESVKQIIKTPIEVLRKFEMSLARYCKLSSAVSNMSIQNRIDILQESNKQLYFQSAISVTTSRNDLSRFGGVAESRFRTIKAEVANLVRGWQATAITMIESGRRKWRKALQSVSHECSPMIQNCVAHWKLDDREGPFRMKTRLARNHMFYHDYGLLVKSAHNIHTNCSSSSISNALNKLPQSRISNSAKYLNHGNTSNKLEITSKTDTLSFNHEDSIIKIRDFDPAESLESYVPIQDGAILLKLNVLMSKGLEAIEGVLIVCSAALHFVADFAVDPGTGVVSQLRNSNLTSVKFRVQLLSFAEDTRTDGRSYLSGTSNEKNEKTPQRDTSHHDSVRMAMNKIRELHKRRYLLRHVAIELFDTDGRSLFIAFSTNEERDELYNFLWHMHMPSCIWHEKNAIQSESDAIQVAVTSTPKRVRRKFKSHQAWSLPQNTPGQDTKLSIPLAFRTFRERLTRNWMNGKLSNFAYLMYLNSLAGRSTNDLTQYPVFPWILSQYSDSVLNLSDPNTFRDLSKPMGALNDVRAKDFASRYKHLAEMNDPRLPPFHYGTHYSTSGYTLYYLLRLEPFSQMGARLQNGRFDNPSRLFRSINASWLSASGGNVGATQDVRELIPEFFYLPRFLINDNEFDFGETQDGLKIDDVDLPPWANNSAFEFVRIHRLALESDYVSKNLHNWIDLVFGYKQLGKDAEVSQNVFMAQTYEGEVVVDDIEDDNERAAMLSQILNYGQTPSQIFEKPHPQKKPPPKVSRFSTKSVVNSEYHSGLSGPFVIPGVFPPVCSVKTSVVSQRHRIGSTSSSETSKTTSNDIPVVDIFMTQERIRYICSPQKVLIAPPTGSKYVSFGYADGSCRFHVANEKNSKHSDVGSIVSIHEGLHVGIITCAAATKDGGILITGGEDCTIAVHSFIRNHRQRAFSLLGRLVCHKGSITSITVCEPYGVIVSGSQDGSAIIWDLHKLEFIRQLLSANTYERKDTSRKISGVACNSMSGEILTLQANEIRIWSINGYLMVKFDLAPGIKEGLFAPVLRVLLLPREPWQDGIAVVTGHENGNLNFWSINYSSDACVVMDNGILRNESGSSKGSNLSNTLEKKASLKIHSRAITALSMIGSGSKTVLATGDQSGKCCTVTLDTRLTKREAELRELL